jgi:hypothetical protein
MSRFATELGRTWVMIGILFILITIKIIWYQELKSLLLDKILLTNAGFLNGHIVRKWLLGVNGPIDWCNDEQKFLKILAIVIYFVFTYGYVMGG